ncbi:hypothetical protein [Salinigranum halophilum]|uniref:hypothetical protein n=1 Tax=Salinigranum halophilum TaxID=2565931 RepID=UPI0010A8A835|nr:hypothetical protein [Salinigranum halophilum]
MAVRVCLPGLDATEHRLSSETAFPLTNTLIQGLSQAPHVKELEVLVISGEHQLECVLTPRLGSAPTSSRAVPIQRTLSEYTTRGATVPDSTADKLAGIAAKTLPDELGIELCDVDLGPIRMWPVTTGRVLLETNGALRQSHFDWNDPFVETVGHLAATQKPFVIQVIVGTGTRAGYVATLRYAVIHPDHAIATGVDESEHLDEGKHHSIEQIWQNAGLQTNYDLPISEFALPGYRYRKWTPEIGFGSRREYDSPRLNKHRYMNMSDSQTALDLYTGTTEYRALFHGRPNATSLYEKLDRYARIPLNDYTLRLFGAVVPLYYETSPWNGVPGRSGPEITTRAVIRRAPGTNHAHGRSESGPSTEQSSGHTVNTGSDGHDQLLSFAVEYFRGQGDEAWIETQDGSSMPDGGHRTSDGTKRALEVEFSSLSKPANPLTNYTRAIAQERPVEFVVTSKAKARRLSDILRRPWKDVTDHGVHLHTQTTTVRLPTGQIPVVPAKGTESNWYLDGEGELTLRTQSGTVLARGPATKSVATFAYDNPRYEHSTDDESHRIVTSEGVTKTTYRTRSQLLDEWTLVHAPLVPVGLHCLSGATIYYQSGEELVEFDAQASWDHTAETATERYRRGVEEFVETYTRAKAGASMRYATFQEACQSLFAIRSRQDPPNKTHIGRVLPDEVEVDSPNASTRKVRDRTLLYPSGLRSPDLPCFETDEENAEMEDEADDTDESADEST